ncbi:MAG: hypothetical protein ACXWX5_12095, partial [Actinomycetota bacterium]
MWLKKHHATAEELLVGFHRKGSGLPSITWARVGELTEMGLMHPAGLAAFERRTAERSGVYSFEQETIALGRAYEQW